ncbi:MAG TPA: roadblock/LC7 domain-containing protein [Desulfurivibrio alkaliphilus]|uniref:Roadblock/LC7 domain-containing protein n=1 Tax=Desulfurivibrio alkaliphilus TaxID=427923 RepID=A0A7C2TJK0_9BACT|nr:roadblock/LC7 domain-containing protein [Desulfurivibrio alkaliphilus]
MRDFVLTAGILERTRLALESSLISAGVRTALLIDGAGNILSNCGQDSAEIDAISLAALAAANLGATSQIAKLIGEEDFSLLFHKGKTDNIHFSRIGDELILITIFREDVSLGLVRCRVNDISATILKIFEGY